MAAYLVIGIIGYTYLPWQFVTMLLGFSTIATFNTVAANWDEMVNDIKTNPIVTN